MYLFNQHPNQETNITRAQKFFLVPFYSLLHAKSNQIQLITAQIIIVYELQRNWILQYVFP